MKASSPGKREAGGQPWCSAGYGKQQGLPQILDRLAAGRRFGFEPERVAFALALQRLCAPGSDLQGAAWAETLEAPGFEDLALHHFYRTVPWLAAIRYELERDLFFRGRDLFSGELDLVFIDTTSVYLYRDGESALVRHGYSRVRRPELPQLVLSVAVDDQGWPVAVDVLPGNTADVDALSQAIARFRERFRIRSAVVVADRGMLGRNILAQLCDHASAPFDYILGCPLRRERAVAKEVLARPLPAGRGQPRGQGGQARRAALRGMPQPDRGKARCCRPRGAAGQAPPDART